MTDHEHEHVHAQSQAQAQAQAQTVRFDGNKILYNGCAEPYTKFYSLIKQELELWRSQPSEDKETKDSMSIIKWLIFAKDNIPCGNCNKLVENRRCLLLRSENCYYGGYGSQYDMDMFVWHRIDDPLHEYPVICDKCVPQLSGNEHRLLFKNDMDGGYTVERFLNDREIAPTPDNMDRVIDQLTKALEDAHKLKSKLA